MPGKIQSISVTPSAGASAAPGEGLRAQAGVRRFPPVLQFVTAAGSGVEQQLRRSSTAAFEQGLGLEQICAALYHRALELGFLATIGLQEVYSTRMPSYPGETVWSVLLLIDLRRAAASA